MKHISDQAINNPLSKEDLRKQFIEQTEKLGLKHTFTFDEAWEIAQEIRKKQEYRQKITELHEQLENEGGIVGKELHKLNPTKHTFSGGCYIREIYNPANMLLVTKIHKVDHPYFLMSGKMSILTEDGVIEVEAPHHGVTKAGTKRVIYTHDPCKFVTVHATNKTTPEEVEEEVIAKSFNDEAICLDEIQSLTEKLGLNVELTKEK